ncbi:RagB/SusD family nutrient uptake outer membrane protein [uncultured Eudoraea sp.]|uniref:RagB/SusD family nutrient uptake outer membrane protein n=1 Tax=uncultured Eudoraea sp. TaxID=1035614 RepID=UPI0026389B79|nr:RagB/SusD family nutrient uptake outer membrane protein [uncultured Eudoraea sp.]
MKTVYKLLLGSLLLITACENDLDQVPSNIASSDSLEDFDGVVNAAYYYQLGAVTPMAVMGDFRADNALMDEEPYPEFDRYGPNLTVMEDQFFGPFYTALYKAILSANNVIENSTDPGDIGEASFLRALSYFKLVLVFGDVTVNLVPNPSTTDPSILVRQPAADVYNNVIIPDLQNAIAALGTEIVNGRASKYAAQGLLGKVYMHRGNFGSAESHLAAVVNGAAAAGISLQANYADIFGEINDLNSEIIFATQVSSSIVDEYPDSEFWSWYGGLDTKSLMPLDPDLIAAFDASDASGGGTDLRRAVNIDELLMASPKFPQTGGPDHDWIELRLADVILLYAEALNENGASPEAVLDLLDPIRTRAGLTPLDHTVLNTTALVRQAIYDERRLELAFEGHRWFDLVRTGTADAEMGETIDSNYLLFPVPISEILATNGVITQNPGY